jgi:hypothetical protein
MTALLEANDETNAGRRSVLSQNTTPSRNRPQLSILTVGDGDFSVSLAILRAYHHDIRSMVVTSLVSSPTELIALYPHAKDILKELQAFPSTADGNHHDDDDTGDTDAAVIVTILFGVDATKLHCDPRIIQECQQDLDFILFHHPHLGYDDGVVDDDAKDDGGCGEDDGEDRRTKVPSTTTATGKKKKHAIRAAKHSSLLAHYLFSARQLLLHHHQNHHQNHHHHRARREIDKETLVHVCLCAGQSKSWKLYPALRRIGLELVGRPSFASKPLWPHLLEVAQPRPSKDDSHHPGGGGDEDEQSHNHIYWLSRYGYRHRATYPSTTQLSTVVNSHHYFFRILVKNKTSDVQRQVKDKRMDTTNNNEVEEDHHSPRAAAVGTISSPHKKRNCHICLQDDEACAY